MIRQNNKLNGLAGKGLVPPRQSETTGITTIHEDTRNAASTMNGVILTFDRQSDT
jgi:hypothetical protein